MQVKEEVGNTYMAIAELLSNNHDDVIKRITAIDEKLDCHLLDAKPFLDLDHVTLKDMTSSWKGVISVKSILIGIASVILALGAIGAGLTAFIKSLLD